MRLRTAATMMAPVEGRDAWLEVERGGRTTQKIPLGAGTAVIGRSSKCEVPLKGSEGVSRKHCKVQFLDDAYVLIDLESRNGTRVNGVHTDRVALKHGDIIEVGDERIRFCSSDAADRGPAPMPASALDQQATALLPLPLEPAPTEPFQGGAWGQTVRLDPSPRTAPAPVEMPKRADEQTSYVVKARQPKQGPMGLLVVGAAVCTVAVVLVAWDFLAGEQRLDAWLAGSDGPAPAGNAASPKATAPATAPPDGDGADAAVQGAPMEEPVAAPGTERAPRSTTTTQATTTRRSDASTADETRGSNARPQAAPRRAEQGSARPSADSAEESVVVVATSAGRVASLRARVGQQISIGDVIATLEAQGAIRKKLDARYAEEREFREAVEAGNAAAQRDLDEVRREIATLRARAQGAPLLSDETGTVAEVLVRAGTVVQIGDALVRLRR